MVSSSLETKLIIDLDSAFMYHACYVAQRSTIIFYLVEIDCECTLLNDAQIHLYLLATYRNNLYRVIFKSKI